MIDAVYGYIHGNGHQNQQDIHGDEKFSADSVEWTDMGCVLFSHGFSPFTLWNLFTHILPLFSLRSDLYCTTFSKSGTTFPSDIFLDTGNVSQNWPLNMAGKGRISSWLCIVQGIS